MKLRKITETDLQGVGVVGMADTPNLSARQMQEKVEEVVRAVVIPVINENIDYTATKQDLADAVYNAGAGDMQSAFYDSNLDGIVNSADNGIFTYTHSKNGTVHNLQGSGENMKFIATADWNPGDSLTVNGKATHCMNSLYERIETEDLFRCSACVTATIRTMLDHNICFFKQGGAGLNFKIVSGTTQPASPRENTIWVNTSIAIAEYAMAAENPWLDDSDTVPTGALWIKTGNSGTAAQFDLLKKNSIYLCPQVCFVYDGSAFVSAPGRIYKDGQWNDFIKSPLYIYNQGESDTAFQQYSIGDNYKNSQTDYNGTTCWRMVSQASKNVTVALRTKEKTDLSGYTVLKALVYSSSGYGEATKGTPNMSLFITDEPSQQLNTDNSAFRSVIANTTLYSSVPAWTEMSLDISDVNGIYYAGAGIGNKTAGAAQMYVKSLWLE